MITLDRRILFVESVLKVLSGDESIENAANLFAEIEDRHKLKIVSDFIDAEETVASNDWCKNTLFPFLTETHFIITGGDLLNSCEIYNVSGQEVSFTWREWGAWLAKWANKFWVERPIGLGNTHWTRKKRNWNYLDFYSRDYLNYQVESYEVWADIIIQIVTKKTEMQKRT